MASWELKDSPSTSTDFSEKLSYNVDTQSKHSNQCKAEQMKTGPTFMTKFKQEHLSTSQLVNKWSNLYANQSVFTGQRSTSKRHYDMQGDDEPLTKRLLSERMAAGMRKLNITDDYNQTPVNDELWRNGQIHDAGIVDDYSQTSTNNVLWRNGLVHEGFNRPNETWKHNLDERLDVDSDESGCEEDQPQLIIEQDILDALIEQNASSSLPPQILTNMKESAMQLVLWKPVPFPGLCNHKQNEEEKSTADSKLNDNMADSPVDEDMDL